MAVKRELRPAAKKGASLIFSDRGNNTLMLLQDLAVPQQHQGCIAPSVFCRCTTSTLGWRAGEIVRNVLSLYIKHYANGIADCSHGKVRGMSQRTVSANSVDV